MAFVQLPDDETLVVAGRVDDVSSSGGGYPHSPPQSHLWVGGRCYTLYNNRHCYPCGRFSRGTGYGRGSMVVISQVHGHYVVREGTLPPAQSQESESAQPTQS